MSEEEKSNEGTPAVEAPSTPSKEEQGGWTKEEQAEYTRKTQRLASIEKRISEKWGMTPDEFLDAVEENTRRAQETEETSDDDAGFTDPAVEKQKAELEQLKKQIAQSEERAKRAEQKAEATWLGSQYSDYVRSQKILDESQRFNIPKKDLLDFMKEKRYAPIIHEEAERLMTEEGEANIFEIAADMYHTRQKRAELRKQGADNQAALDREADSTRVIEGKSMTEKKEEKTEMEKRADDIAEDTPYEMPNE